MSYLFNNALQCPICLRPFDLKEHIPYVLTCGHVICRTSIEQLYKEQEKTIKCPQCSKVIDSFQTQYDIPQLWCLKNVIEEVRDNIMHHSIKTSYENLRSIDKIISKIKQENNLIDQYVQKLIQKQIQAKEFNKKKILEMKAYQFLLKSELENKLEEGIDESQIKKIQEDVIKFRSSYLMLEEFKLQQELNLQQLQEKLKDVVNIAIAQDYSRFITRILYFMNNCKQSRTIKIDDEKFKKIKSLLERNQNLNADEISAISFLYYKGLFIIKNEQKAKRLLALKECQENGCSQFCKYFYEQNKLEYLIKSCNLGYVNAYWKLAFKFGELTQQQQKYVFLVLAKQLNSTYGIAYTGYELFLGNAVQENKKEGAKLMMEAIDKGYYSKYDKKLLDEFYDESEQFRNDNPNYQQWQGQYEDFEKQEFEVL